MVECELELPTSGGSSDAATSGTNSLVERDKSRQAARTRASSGHTSELEFQDSVHPSYARFICLKYKCVHDTTSHSCGKGSFSHLWKHESTAQGTVFPVTRSQQKCLKMWPAVRGIVGATVRGIVGPAVRGIMGPAVRGIMGPVATPRVWRMITDTQGIGLSSSSESLTKGSIIAKGVCFPSVTSYTQSKEEIQTTDLIDV